MKVTVIGCGRWGSLIAWYLDRMGHEVTLYGKSDSPQMQQFLKTGKNDLLRLSDSTKLSTSLEEAVMSEVIIISIPSQALRSLMEAELAPLCLKNKIFVLCMKGIEVESGKRLSEIVTESTDCSNKVAIWVGPGHVQEFYVGHPGCMVIDSLDEAVKDRLIKAFSGDLIRFYYGNDMIGNEIGAASKNVVGIAAGFLDGMGLSSMKGALMSRGTREISRLMEAIGANPMSAYGLCHLGDYEATVFSQHSHNRMFGELFVKGVEYGALAEGYYTAAAMKKLAERYHVELPICMAVYRVLYENADVKAEMAKLFQRSQKGEF